MTQGPDHLLEHPPAVPAAPFSDPLSDVLRTVRLRGAVFFMLDVSSPWATGMPDGAVLAPLVVPSAQQVVSFHIITEGSCWGGLLDGPQRQLEAGDIVVFPRGDGYCMSLAPQAPLTPDADQALAFMKGMTLGQLPFMVKMGGGGHERLGMVCGFLGCDLRPYNPVLSSLPRLLHIKRALRPADDRLDRLLELTLAESREFAPGAESVRLRLSELLFVEVIRRHLNQLPPEEAGWLGAVRDEFIGPALVLLHERPARSWTLEELSAQVGLSRSALAERFTRLVGEPPMQYLARWRMQVAARLLSDGSAKVSAVGLEVGYDSEAAFSRAFKKIAGESPAAWRRRGLRST